MPGKIKTGNIWSVYDLVKIWSGLFKSLFEIEYIKI